MSESLLNRLLAERKQAHQRYNEALTALDKAIQSAPDLPRPPAAYDETLLPKINDTWEIVPKAAPRPEEWARVFEKQMAFNAAVVEHLNRNVAAHRDAHLALERALPALREGFDALERFESLLVQFLQTITPLSDTHYREISDAIAQLRSVTDVAQKTAMLAKREVERRESGSREPGSESRKPRAGSRERSERISVCWL